MNPISSIPAGAEIIADFPAWTIIRAKPRFHYGLKVELPTFKAGDIVGLPFESRNHGIMHHWFRFGSVISYALENDECPMAAMAKTVERGHNRYWLNPVSSMLMSERSPKEVRPAISWSERIAFQGRIFTVRPAANSNAELVEVEGGGE